MISKKIASLLILALFFSAVYAQTDSISYYKKALENKRMSAGFTPKDTTYIKLLNSLSARYKNINTDTIAILAKEALELSNATNYEKGRLEALTHLAIYELLNGNTEKSISYSNQVLDKLDIEKFPRLGANIYNLLGETYFRSGNNPESYKHAYSALILAEKTKDKELIRKLNSNLGTLFTFLEDYDEALKFYTIALTSFDENDQSPIKSGILANLSYLYLKKNNYVKALELLDKSAPALEQANIIEMLNMIYLGYGTLYYHTNNFDKALDYFQKANTYYKSSNDIFNKALSYYGLGTTHLARNEFKKADEFLNLGLGLYRTIKFKTGIEETYRSLYKLNKKIQSEEKALYFLEQAEVYSDSILGEKSLRDISMWRAKTEFEKEKLILQQESDTEVLKQKNYFLWIGLGLACAIFIAILIFQVNKTERKLNRELALQSKNLSKKQDELNKINTNQDKLFSIVGHDLRGPIVSLKQLLGLALQDESGVQHFYKFGPKLKKDVDHIHFTLDNLLIWGKTQMQGEPLNPIQMNLKEELLVIEVLFRDVLDKKSIIIHKENLDDLTLTADPNHFKIIFRNLISNALKFTPENGSIWLASSEEKDAIVIQVKDSGIGMSEAVVDKLFNQSEYHTTFGTNNERGTGLGLILCKEMVLKNKGDIWVKSTIGKGSTFYVRFPKEPLILKV